MQNVLRAESECIGAKHRCCVLGQQHTENAVARRAAAGPFGNDIAIEMETIPPERSYQRMGPLSICALGVSRISSFGESTRRSIRWRAHSKTLRIHSVPRSVVREGRREGVSQCTADKISNPLPIHSETSRFFELEYPRTANPVLVTAHSTRCESLVAPQCLNVRWALIVRAGTRHQWVHHNVL